MGYILTGQVLVRIDKDGTEHFTRLTHNDLVEIPDVVVEFSGNELAKNGDSLPNIATFMILELVQTWALYNANMGIFHVDGFKPFSYYVGYIESVLQLSDNEGGKIVRWTLLKVN